MTGYAYRTSAFVSCVNDVAAAATAAQVAATSGGRGSSRCLELLLPWPIRSHVLMVMQFIYFFATA